MSEWAVFVNSVLKLFRCVLVWYFKEWKTKVQILHLCIQFVSVLVLKTAKNGYLLKLAGFQSLWCTVFLLSVSESLIHIYGESEIVLFSVEILLSFVVVKQNNVKIHFLNSKPHLSWRTKRILTFFNLFS